MAWWQLTAFLLALAFFHTSEFLLAALLDRGNLSMRCGGLRPSEPKAGPDGRLRRGHAFGPR